MWALLHLQQHPAIRSAVTAATCVSAKPGARGASTRGALCPSAEPPRPQLLACRQSKAPTMSQRPPVIVKFPLEYTIDPKKSRRRRTLWRGTPPLPPCRLLIPAHSRRFGSFVGSPACQHWLREGGKIAKNASRLAFFPPQALVGVGTPPDPRVDTERPKKATTTMRMSRLAVLLPTTAKATNHRRCFPRAPAHAAWPLASRAGIGVTARTRAFTAGTRRVDRAGDTAPTQTTPTPRLAWRNCRPG